MENADIVKDVFRVVRFGLERGEFGDIAMMSLLDVPPDDPARAARLLELLKASFTMGAMLASEIVRAEITATPEVIVPLSDDELTDLLLTRTIAKLDEIMNQF